MDLGPRGAALTLQDAWDTDALAKRLEGTMRDGRVLVVAGRDAGERAVGLLKLLMIWG